MKNYSLDEAKKTVALCEENGWEIVTPDSEYYPYLLHEIHAKPLVLYVNGDVSVLKHPLPIAFVGTRDASANGIKIAEEYAYSLAKAGALIVSGGALGSILRHIWVRCKQLPIRLLLDADFCRLS